MIRWLVESIDVHPDLLRGEAPVGLLGAPEQAELAAFKVLKRRQDWLLGRWTAKHLIQTHLGDSTSDALPLEQLAIKHEAAGAPYVTISDPALERRLPVDLSISHSNGYAFCALYDAQLDENECGIRDPEGAPECAGSIPHSALRTPHFTIGADIEYIEPRDRSFITDFFTASEIAAVEQTLPTHRDALVTAIWSAKEAVLKALRIGLRVDTRSIHCTFTPLPNETLASSEWLPFVIETADASLGQFTGWWRTLDNFVLTLAVRSN